MVVSETFTESYGTSPSSDGKPSQQIDVTFIVGPGVYGIVHTPSGKVYYGETEELGTRLNRHKKALEKVIDDNGSLQAVWDETADPTKFKFLIYECGPGWEDNNVRKVKETAMVLENSDNCFNTLPNTKHPNDIRIPIVYKNVRYNSTRDAARTFGIARSTITRHLRDKTKPDCYYLTPETYGEIPVFAQIGKNGKEGPVLVFPSLGAVVDAGYATSTQMVRRRIQSQNFINWRYASLDKTGEPVRQPYELKPGEISYKQWLEKQN